MASAFSLNDEIQKSMIDVLASLMQVKVDWCPKYYHAGGFYSVETPLWGIMSSAAYGLVAHQAVPLKNANILDGIWRSYYNAFVRNVEQLGLSKLGLASQEEMRRCFELLCNRNHYPANSVAHVFAWSENSPSGGVTDFAIFQCKYSHGVFDDDGLKHIILEPTKDEVVNLSAGAWADVTVEALARQKVDVKSRIDGFDYCGMRLNRPDGRIARTTLGNIYFTRSRNVIGVKEGEGAKPDPLRQFLLQAIDELNQENPGGLPITYTEVDGVDDETMKNSGGCFVCDSAVGVVPILRINKINTYSNELVRIITTKFRSFF